MQIVEVEDAAFGIERRRNDALPAEYRARAETRGEHIHVLHAVEERQDRRIHTDCRHERIHCRLQVVSLAAQ